MWLNSLAAARRTCNREFTCTSVSHYTVEFGSGLAAHAHILSPSRIIW